MSPSTVDRLSVQAKLRLLRDLVADLEEVGEVDADRLRRERLTLRAVERILTQVVEVAAAVCSHLVSARVPVAPSSYRAAFEAAGSLGVLDAALATSLAAGAGLRNLLVHEYVRVDLGLVAAAVPRARIDAEAFVRAVAGYLTTSE